MDTFPMIDPSVAPQVGSQRAIVFATQVVETGSGIERRRLLQTYPREAIEAVWGPRDDSRWVAEQLSAFFRKVGGAAIPFVAYDFDYSFGHQRIYVGTGDASQTVWNLPCRDTATSIVIYADGVEVDGADYTLSDDGDNERKKITFDTAPTAGKVITSSFVGQRAWVCRFAEDTLALSFEDAGLYGLTVRLVTVKGE